MRNSQNQITPEVISQNRRRLGFSSIAGDVDFLNVLNSELCSLASLAACFANITHGLPRTAQMLQDSVAASSDEFTPSSGSDNGITDEIEELANALRYVTILDFDCFWERLRKGIRDENSASGSPSNTPCEILNALTALSDYYAAILRGQTTQARANSGIINDEEAQGLLAEILLEASLPVEIISNYPTVNGSVLWERWDNEPAGAFNWFKQYREMGNDFGFRDFAQFQLYLVGGTQAMLHRTKPKNLKLISPDVEAEAVTTKAAGGQLKLTSDVDKQELLRIRAYYHLFYWELRAKQFDNWERLMLRQRSERRAAYLLDEQFSVFSSLFSRIYDRVGESIELLSPAEAMKALQDVARMLRLSAGYFTDKPFRNGDAPSTRGNQTTVAVSSSGQPINAQANIHVDNNVRPFQTSRPVSGGGLLRIDGGGVGISDYSSSGTVADVAEFSEPFENVRLLVNFVPTATVVENAENAENAENGECEGCEGCEGRRTFKQL